MYRVMPNSEFWAGGVFCVPKGIMKKIKLTDPVKISVLTVALGSDEIDEKEISVSLRIDIDEVREALDFWCSEGILTDEKVFSAPEETEQTAAKVTVEALPMPNLTPRDITAMCRENDELALLLRNAQTSLGSTISASMQSNLINMVTYYGLTVPVVLTLLHYYKTEREKGRSFSARDLLKMAKEWAEDEINTLEKASQKLQDIQDVSDLWSLVVELCELEYRKPSAPQKRTLLRWKTDFSNEMILFAINVMKKYNEKEKWSVKEIDNILKDWKRKELKTPEEVKNYKKPESKSEKKSGKLQSSPSFDINQIANDTILNDDYDI